MADAPPSPPSLPADLSAGPPQEAAAPAPGLSSTAPTSRRVRARLARFTAQRHQANPVLDSAIKKAAKHLMPMLVILYFVAFLDRTYPSTPYTAEHHERRFEALEFEA